MPLEKAPIKSLYKALVTLKPIVVTNTSLSTDPIKIETTDKTLPGIEAAETWDIKTDDPEQEISQKVVGKLGGLSQLDFAVVYDPILQNKLVDHVGTRFDVVYVYDDAELNEIVAITAKDCFLVTPGSTGSAANASAGTMTVSVQPRGGGKLRDCLEVTTSERPSTESTP